MRALVTGSHGFVGRHLVAHLRAEGDEVDELDTTAHDRVDVTSAAAVRKRLKAVRPDAVYHLAALSHIGSSWQAPNKVLRVNVEGTLNVLRAAADAAVSRVLVVGSADEYGRVDPGDLPLTEDAPLRPMTPYGASKVAAEFVALQAFLGTGTPVVRVRAFNHTGPGQDERFVVSAIGRHVALAERDGEGEIRLGSLESVRDFTDVRDVVRAYRMLVTNGTVGEVYNVCSGTGRSVAEVADHMLALAGRDLKLVIDPALVRPIEVPRLIGSNARVRAATGWAPTISFDDTLRDVLADWRARL
jgi:GDP-4-dehydro-6-deoxy-D-mannose reductase